MRAYVDKVEDDRAELRLGETETTVVVLPLALLPPGVREGDVLALTFSRDEVATRAEAAANDRKRAALLDRSRDEPF